MIKNKTNLVTNHTNKSQGLTQSTSEIIKTIPEDSKIKMSVTPSQKRSLMQISEDGKTLEVVPNMSQQPQNQANLRREKAKIYQKNFKIKGIVKTYGDKSRSNNESYQSSVSKSAMGFPKHGKWKNLTSTYLQSPIEFTNSRPNSKIHKKRSSRRRSRAKSKRIESGEDEIKRIKCKLKVENMLCFFIKVLHLSCFTEC